jgi:tRNA nucleotidyltransferase (CCA-adding enzyme)
METAIKICRAIRQAGGRALLVGGCVRDHLMGQPWKDFDIEVYGIEPDDLRRLLDGFGEVNTVGESFTVYKLRVADAEHVEIDVSVPRRESKTGRGHRGFTVTGDPFMTIEEAARRRDFTINAILYDPLTGELIDPFNGRADLQNRLLRVVDPNTFPDDSLRVLRAMQFAARFEFEIDPSTKGLCRSIDLSDLPSERIWGEFEKLFLLARRPSIGLQAALDLLVVEKLLPDLKPLVDCPQDSVWHPEGPVWVHTLMAVDNAVELTAGLPKEIKLTVRLAVLLHDIAKPLTIRYENGRIRTPGHEDAGVEPSLRVLDTLNVHTINGYDVRSQVVALVANHLKPSAFFKDRERVTDGAFRRLAAKCDLELLYLVAKADALARGPASGSESEDWFIERARGLGVEHAPPKPILMGRHLIELGVEPGPQMGQLLKAVYELQLDGKVSSLEEAMETAGELLAEK